MFRMEPRIIRRMMAWLMVAAASLPTLALCVYLALAVDLGTVRLAELSGDAKSSFSKKGTVIDYGYSNLGYVMVRQEDDGKRYKLRVTKGDGSYTYDINLADGRKGEFEVIPLQMGSGKYKFQMYRQKKGNEYTAASSVTISAQLDESEINYLYPNQYVNYNADTKAIEKSFELCEGLSSDKEKIDAIYEWVCENIRYDYILAMSVKAGYLPDIDQVLDSKTGICFGYAALMACMLRVQGIPTQLVIGYADRTYHAWNNIRIDGEWMRYDATFAATNSKVGQYTPEKRY